MEGGASASLLDNPLSLKEAEFPELFIKGKDLDLGHGLSLERRHGGTKRNKEVEETRLERRDL